MGNEVTDRGLGFKLAFVPIFYFVVPCSPFCNIRTFQARNLNQKPLGSLSNNDSDGDGYGDGDGDGYENVT